MRRTPSCRLIWRSLIASTRVKSSTDGQAHQFRIDLVCKLGSKVSMVSLGVPFYSLCQVQCYIGLGCTCLAGAAAACPEQYQLGTSQCQALPGGVLRKDEKSW